MLLAWLKGADGSDHPSGKAASRADVPCRPEGFQPPFLLLFRSYPFISPHRKENLFHEQ